MRILLVGTGGVGSAFAAIASRREYFDHIVLSDIHGERAKSLADRLGDRFSGIAIDASKPDEIAEAARSFGCDVIMNAADPRFVMPIFDAAFAVGCTYVDMAMSMSEPDRDEPYRRAGKKLGDDQFAKAEAWSDRGLLALVGMGVEPGLSDVFARYAADHLFSTIEEIGVRDGADLEVEGYAFAPSFSIWTTIEECLNPPIVWERGREWYTTPPFSEPEVFSFPEGIGPIECVNVEHEEVVLIPRYLDAGRVTFKYGLGDEFIGVLQTLHLLGLDSTTPVQVGGASVSPRDVVAAVLPNPAELGDRMRGKTCAGTWVRGTGKDGGPRDVYLYHVADNEETMARDGSQAVVWQTAINPVIALELIQAGTWSGAGVLGPEAFDAEPFLDLLKAHDSPWGLEERRPSA
jgi:saccharopine dehydrogenase (NAD+, L-lysine forming)